mgnify:CR=1 FL=1
MNLCIAVFSRVPSGEETDHSPYFGCVVRVYMGAKISDFSWLCFAEMEVPLRDLTECHIEDSSARLVAIVFY